MPSVFKIPFLMFILFCACSSPKSPVAPANNSQEKSLNENMVVNGHSNQDHQDYFASPEFTAQMEKMESDLKVQLPPNWKVQVKATQQMPFQWKGNVAQGIRIELSNPSLEQKRPRPYAQLFRDAEKEIIVRPQLIRYLYRHLQAGYSYSLFERAHPSEIETVTADFVVIRPSNLTTEADYDVPSTLRTTFENYLRYPSHIGQYSVEVEQNAGPTLSFSNLAQQYPGKRALIIHFSSPENKEQGLKVSTIE